MPRSDEPAPSDRPSFAEEFLPRLNVDGDQLLAVLDRLDDQLADHGASLTLEVAEETYADAYWETDVDRNRTHDFFVVYVDRSVASLQAAAPGSVFDRMDSEGTTHDLYVGNVVVRFVTGTSHAVVRPFETDFECLRVGRPTEESVYRVWAEHRQE